MGFSKLMSCVMFISEFKIISVAFLLIDVHFINFIHLEMKIWTQPLEGGSSDVIDNRSISFVPIFRFLRTCCLPKCNVANRLVFNSSVLPFKKCKFGK